MEEKTLNTKEPYTKEKLVLMAEKLISLKITFGQLDKDKKYLKDGNKGDLGQLVEDCWFGQKPHSDPEPDFKEAGIELKVSPYYETKNGVSAKERLVCDIINYKNESLSNKTFFESSFWHKCRNILLLSYKHDKKGGKEDTNIDIQKKDLFVDKFALIEGYPEEDLLIIQQDWEIIISKIRAGKAHEISEGDTKYLGACTKGDTAAKSLVKQPFNDDILAKQRAYSLKTTYMTKLLRKYIFGEEESEHVITDISQLKSDSFENIIIKRIMRYQGWTEEEIAETSGVNTKAKQHYACMTNYMIGLGKTPRKCEEFESANIQVKSLHVKSNGSIKESISFPYFRFKDLITQEWETSDLYNEVVSARFLFVIYKIDELGVTRLEAAKFWNMPIQDTEEVHKVWSKTIEEVKKGAGLQKVNKGEKEIVTNTLPGLSFNRVAHVRPHTNRSAYKLKDGTIIGNLRKDGDELPNGEWMTKQCFWLNAKYVGKVIKNLLDD